MNKEAPQNKPREIGSTCEPDPNGHSSASIPQGDSLRNLVAEFAEAVVKHQQFMTVDHIEANKHHSEYTRVKRKLFRLGDKGISAFENLLEDERSVVRVTAAAYLIHVRTAAALRVLKWEAKQDTLLSPLAIVTLKRWELGTYFDPITGKLTQTG